MLTRIPYSYPCCSLNLRFLHLDTCVSYPNFTAPWQPYPIILLPDSQVLRHPTRTTDHFPLPYPWVYYISI